MSTVDPFSLISFGLGALGSVIGIYSYFTNNATSYEARFKDLENKCIEPALINDICSDIKTIKTKLDPIWDAMMTELPKLLISPHTPRMDELILKYTDNYKLMTEDEKYELLGILSSNFNTIHPEDVTRTMVATFTMKILIKDLEPLKNKILLPNLLLNN